MKPLMMTANNAAPFKSILYYFVVSNSEQATAHIDVAGGGAH